MCIPELYNSPDTFSTETSREMDPALQLLYAYDINHHINALASSIEQSWNFDTTRDRAGSLISRFICQHPRGTINTTMTKDLVTSITFHCMITPIQHLSPVAAQEEATRILHNMHSLQASLDAQRSQDHRDIRLRREALDKEKKTQRRAENDAEKQRIQHEKRAAENLRLEMQIIWQRRRVEHKLAYDDMIRNRMWFPKPWPNEEPWGAEF